MPRSHSLIQWLTVTIASSDVNGPACLGYLDRPTTRHMKRIPDVTGQTLLVWQLAAFEVENNSPSRPPLASLAQRHQWGAALYVTDFTARETANGQDPVAEP